jgi:hypothetical protein
MVVNDPNADQTFKSYELAAFKRLGHRWQFAASYSSTRLNVPYLPTLTGGAFTPAVEVGPLNPNAEINQTDRTREWQGKLSGVYIFPHDVLVSGSYESRNGDPYARQVQFTGGRTIPSIVVNVEPIGARQLPTIHNVNARVEKTFTVLSNHKLAVRANVFNVLNANTVLGVTMRAGAAFERPSSLMSPRILEFSTTYSF